MSFFTPADADYIKGSVRKIKRATLEEWIAEAESEGSGKHFREEGLAEHARLEAFIDGCTLEKGKGSE